jgi:23S rRNA (cytosine1962-C5)-methyltransferase
MFQPDQYELIDFGDGEKLERFGDQIVRRQSPSVAQYSCDKRRWKSDLQFSRSPQPNWTPDFKSDQPWSIHHGKKRFLLKPSPSGQVGVFPEQVENWDWIDRQRDRIAGMKAINLFAYTGGTTMQLADCGVDVTHVDAAKPVVGWARQNAEASDLAANKIRWIVDDALTYLKREAKRKNQYQIIVADPPSFGRGPKGAVWKIQRDLPEMLDLLRSVTDDLQMLIVSCHTPQMKARDLRQLAVDHFPIDRRGGETLGLKLKNRQKKTLDSGECFRWSQK